MTKTTDDRCAIVLVNALFNIGDVYVVIRGKVEQLAFDFIQAHGACFRLEFPYAHSPADR